MENCNFHLEQLGEFDKPFATLNADLWIAACSIQHWSRITGVGRTWEIRPGHWPAN